MPWNLKPKEFVNFLPKPGTLCSAPLFHILVSRDIWAESFCFRLMDLVVRLMEIWGTFLSDKDICFSPSMKGINTVLLIVQESN